MDALRDVKKTLRKKNSTRWNTIYLMLVAFLKLDCSEVEKILLSGCTTNSEKREARKKDLTDIEREQAVELNEILEQLYIFTNIIQGDGVTISRLIPSLNTVISRIDLRKRHEEAKASNSSIQDRTFYYEDFSSRLIEGLKSRFEYAFKDQIFTISSILDPNYGMTWIPVEDRSHWIEKIKLMITEIDETETLGSMTARLTANKISPLNTWTINLDAHEETFEEEFEYKTMIKNFLSTQKQARIEVKKASEIKGDKDACVDPLNVLET